MPRTPLTYGTHRTLPCCPLACTAEPLACAICSLMVGGEFFNLLAYGYSPTSLVAPVGAIGVLVNGVIATAVMKVPIYLASVVPITSAQKPGAP
jgi:hypothetical protein